MLIIGGGAASISCSNFSLNNFFCSPGCNLIAGSNHDPSLAVPMDFHKLGVPENQRKEDDIGDKVGNHVGSTARSGKGIDKMIGKLGLIA